MRASPTFQNCNKGDTPTVGGMRKGCAPQNKVTVNKREPVPKAQGKNRAWWRTSPGPHSSSSGPRAYPPPPAPPAPRPGPAPQDPASYSGTDWPRPPSLPRAALGIGRRSHARHALSSSLRASLRAGRAGSGGERGRTGNRTSGGVRLRPRPHGARAARSRPNPAPARRLRLAASSPHSPAPAALLQDQPTEGLCVLRTT